MLILKIFLTVLILLMIAKTANVKYVDKFKIEYSFVILGAIILMYNKSDVVEYSSVNNATIQKLQTLFDVINKLLLNDGDLSDIDIVVTGNVEIDGSLSLNSSNSKVIPRTGTSELEVNLNNFDWSSASVGNGMRINDLNLKLRNAETKQTLYAKDLIQFGSDNTLYTNTLRTYRIFPRPLREYQNPYPQKKYANLVFEDVHFKKTVSINTGTSPSFTNRVNRDNSWFYSDDWESKEQVCNGDIWVGNNGFIKVQKYDHNTGSGHLDTLNTGRKELMNQSKDAGQTEIDKCREGTHKDDKIPIGAENYSQYAAHYNNGSGEPWSNRDELCYATADCYTGSCRNSVCTT